MPCVAVTVSINRLTKERSDVIIISGLLCKKMVKYAFTKMHYLGTIA